MNNQKYFAHALLDAELLVPNELFAWNKSDPTVRFSVYRNNVITSLTDALADTFPVTQELVGEDFFRAMTRVFLQTHPSKSKLLVWLGSDFSAFIKAFEPVSELKYLADVAQLEMFRVRAYHAADTHSIELQVIEQALTNPDTLINLKVTLHPSMHLLQSQYAVWSLWAAHQGLLPIETVQPEQPETVAIFRNQLDVEVHQLSSAEGNFLNLLKTGAPLVHAANTAFECDTNFDLGSSLAQLIQWKLITSLSTESQAL